MRFYFFQTSMQDRGKGPQPTLRALPGQTFEDGTPVNETYNVQAPKERGSNKGGSRLDYPDGTYFCSTHLEEVVTSNGVTYYSVYDVQNGGVTDNLDFHPVTDDPGFNYVLPTHRSDRMNAAFVKFLTFGDQSISDDEAKKQQNGKPSSVRTPVDSRGKAAKITSWAQSYDDQLETEGNLIVQWFKRVLNEKGIKTMARRPKYDEVLKEELTQLYAGGENIGTLVSRTRFEKVLREQKMDAMGLQNISKGPLNWYMDELVNEHKKQGDSTFSRRDLSMQEEVDDVAFAVNVQMNILNATSNNYNDPVLLNNTRKALESGWELEHMLDPEILQAKSDTASLMAAFADGSIPLPKNISAGGASFIEQLMANKKNTKPKKSDGFSVDELTWKVLIANLYRHRHTIIYGPSGSGKTELIRLLCERTGTPLTIIPMGTITDPTEQLVGKMDLDPATGGTRFDWADFALAVQRPGVVLLDEINRCPKNGWNTLFSVLDGTALLVASGAKSTDQRTIKVNPECVFFATANVGYEYTGTGELDLALKTRFFATKVNYLSIKDETDILVKRTGIEQEDALNIATVAANIRKSKRNGTLEGEVSTRETLRCAELVADGFSVEDSLELGFLPLFEEGATDRDPNSECGKVRAMIAKQFN